MGIHRFVIEGTQYEVNVGSRAGTSVRVSVNGKDYDVELGGTEQQGDAVREAPRAAPVVTSSGPRPASASRGQVRAPISGVVLRVEVQPGQKIQRGTVLLILEAMKMENEIIASEDGTVQSLNVKPSQDVREGDLLVVIA